MMRDPNCIFCQIVADTTRCVLLAEDEAALAFMDIHPASEGHCLLIPKAHYPTIFATPPEVFASVGRLVVRVSTAVRDALQPAGLSLVQANGEAANQTVPHLHVHVLPRRAGDGLLINWPRTAEGDPARIADIAMRIRERLASTSDAHQARTNRSTEAPKRARTCDHPLDSGRSVPLRTEPVAMEFALNRPQG